MLPELEERLVVAFEKMAAAQTEQNEMLHHIANHLENFAEALRGIQRNYNDEREMAHSPGGDPSR